MKYFALLLVLLLGPFAGAQEPAGIAQLEFLVGEFSGQGNHPYGTYDETIRSEWGLGGSVLELRSRSEIQGNTVFEDLRVFSWDAGRSVLRMRQWSRGLLREYTGKAEANGDLVFDETSREGASDQAWRYTFTRGEGGGFAYRVEALHGTEWKPYVSGVLTASIQDPGKVGALGMRQYDVEIDGMKAQVHHPDGEGPFPAIVFSPGGNANTFQGYRPYGRWYATWGYVTVITAFDDAKAEVRAPKFSRVADWLIAETAREGSPLHGMIDTDRLAAAGHSRGGNAALRAAASDPRFTACMALAPSGPQEPVDGPGGKARTLIVGAEKDDLLAAGKKAYGITPGERYLIVIAGMTHMLAPREATLKLVARSTAFLRYALSDDARYRAHLVREAEGLTITSAER